MPRGWRTASNQTQGMVAQAEYKVNTYSCLVNSNGSRKENYVILWLAMARVLTPTRNYQEHLIVRCFGIPYVSHFERFSSPAPNPREALS